MTSVTTQWFSLSPKHSKAGTKAALRPACVHTRSPASKLVPTGHRSTGEGGQHLCSLWCEPVRVSAPSPEVSQTKVMFFFKMINFQGKAYSKSCWLLMKLLCNSLFTKWSTTICTVLRWLSNSQSQLFFPQCKLNGRHMMLKEFLKYNVFITKG